VLANEAERPYITGERPLLKASPERLRRMSERLSHLPDERRRAFIDAFRNVRGRVDRTVRDGERLPYCGGIVVIHTPGHTPGHISLYLELTKTLVAGDALNVVDGRLVGPSPQAAEDVDQAFASLALLAPYEIKTVVCYHGGPYANGVNGRIAELASASVRGQEPR
jgi:glyoxylase-like metal-dependent hydrolase (beta-lactamase superfamily II)